MDAKEILRLMIQHRFWISLGIAALLPMIGYLFAAGDLTDRIESKTQEIKSAQDGAEQYTSGPVVNAQYSQFYEPKIEEVQEDVNEAWRRLYKRQAPLLDWPDAVAEDFKNLSRDTYPEDLDPSEILKIGYDYTTVYDDYADKVYQTFDPWDSETGEGIVVASPKEVLLQTVQLDQADPPSLSKMWQLQENLWVRRSILEVIDEVNERAGATDWESAAIKQINELIVGSQGAIDHWTLASGEATLKEPPDLSPDGATAPASTATTKAASGGMSGGQQEMAMMNLGGLGGLGGGSRKAGEPVKFLQPQGVEQYRIYPAYLSVMIDQNSIHNLLAAFENSPMSMRVMEVSWKRPAQRITPPEKGQDLGSLAGMGSAGLGSGGGVMGMYGGQAMMGMEEYQAAGRMGGGDMASMMQGRMGMGNYGNRSSTRNQRTKVKRDPNARTDADDQDVEEPEKVAIFDPYYNVVELQVYVQARFYYPPPPREEQPESPGDASAAAEAEASLPEAPAMPDAEDALPEAPAMPDAEDALPEAPAMPDAEDALPEAPTMPDADGGLPEAPEMPDNAALDQQGSTGLWSFAQPWHASEFIEHA